MACQVAFNMFIMFLIILYRKQKQKISLLLVRLYSNSKKVIKNTKLNYGIFLYWNNSTAKIPKKLNSYY